MIPGAVRADNRPDGVTVVLGNPPGGQLPERVLSELATRLVESLRPGLTVPVERFEPAVAADHLFDDLRLLPRRLHEHLASAASWPVGGVVVCVNLDSPAAGQVAAEVAVVDLGCAAVLGYKSVLAPAAALAGRLAEMVAQVALAAMPPAWRTASSDPALTGRPAPLELASLRTARAPLARDSAQEAVAARAPALPAAAPLEAAWHLIREPGPGAPELRVDLAAVLARYAGQATAAGLGKPSGPVWVEEGRCEVTLNAAARAGAFAPDPINAKLTVIALGERTRIEASFSRKVKAGPPVRNGNWVCVDLQGVRPDHEEALDVGRSGLLSVRLKPLDGPDRTRLAFELTDAGEMTFGTGNDGCTLIATARKDERRALFARLVNPSPPFDRDFSVVRRFNGVASWYGGGWDGGSTASGERYDQWGWTAAHRSLPMGTWIRVTNPDNGKSAILRVNDRGPFVYGRVLDVSVACAKALGFYGRGTCGLQVDVLELH